MNIKSFILLMLLLLSWPGLAQKTWSLEECITYATSENLLLRDFQLTTLASKEDHRQAIRNLLPEVSGFSSYNIRYGRSTDPNTNDIVNTDFFSNAYALNTSLDLFQGFRRIHAIKAAQFLHLATQEEALQQKYLLAFRVMSAYYDIQYFTELLQVSEEQVQLSQDNYDLVKRQIDLGMEAGADLYEAESLLLSDQLNRTQTKNLLAAAKLSLIQEINLENASDIQIEKRVIDSSQEERFKEVNADSVYLQAEGFLPIIKSSKLRIEAAEKEVLIAKAALYPSLRFFAGIGTGYFETNVNENGSIIPFTKQIKSNASSFVGVSVSIPLLDRWSARSNIKQQKITLLRANNELQLQQQELFQLIQQLALDQFGLQMESKESAQQVEAQQLAFTIAQRRYEKGLISTLDLFQAKQLYASSQTAYLQVKFRSIINENTIRFYSGLPVFKSVNK